MTKELSSATEPIAPPPGSPAKPDDLSVIDFRLVRALALGGKRSSEIQLLLDSQADGQASCQELALLLTGLSVAEEKACATFEKLRAHRERMQAGLGRTVRIKTAAMDWLEWLEAARKLRDDGLDLTYDQLVQMAFRDHLTGLENYRSFERRIEQEIRRAGRYRHLASLIMLDIDHFKKFNDTFGHESGNEALVHLAGLLTERARETDVVARFGGEEFVLILPETTKHEAMALARTIREAVESQAVELKEHGAQGMTVSVGVATYPRDAGDTKSLIERADQALYASKDGGRNQVTEYVPDTLVELCYRPDHEGSAQTVHVVGDFNGWANAVDELKRDEDGEFRVNLALAPGRYVYKFVLNREYYIPDPRAAAYEHDGFGGHNSMLTVSEQEDA